MTVQSHNLVQGSNEWRSFRAKHFGASEASAMLGLSPYKTRTQLLHEKKTGLTQEVNPATQKVFDNGHRVEALARPIAEKIIGEELSPKTFSNGRLSASCDGITFMDDIAWENKQFNAAHYEQVINGELPEIHWPQCQQVMYCSGAEKLFFTVSDGTEERTAGVWVFADAELQNQIIAGWAQFEADLATHVPPVHIEKVEAETIQALPVPSVIVRGEITASNISEITPKFDAYLGNIKTELSTDQDFADAEANAKNCRETAKRIEALQENIIAQMVSVNELNSTLENYKAAFNKVGLRLEKAVKEQKETLKTQAIMKAKIAYSDFVTELNKDIPVMLSMKLVCPDFAGAIKGVKTIGSMQSRINDALAQGKVEAAVLANDVKNKLAYINEAIKGYEHLFAVQSMCFADIDYIKMLIQSTKDAEDKRKAEHEALIKAHGNRALSASVNEQNEITTSHISLAQSAGKVLTETREGITMPADFSFATVNDYIHVVGVHFEDLQYLCLALASYIDKLKRGEFICQKCGLRKDGEHDYEYDF